MEIWGLTHPGRVRPDNQDFYCTQTLAPETVLAVVCDGMGGAKAGSVASRLAAEVFAEEVKRSWSPEQTPQEMERMLRAAAALANVSVFEHAQLSDAYSGMGTTLVACLHTPKATLVVNVGDSRAYHIGADGLRQITRDHSVVELMIQRGELSRDQARQHPRKNLITRAVGTGAQVCCDTFFVKTEQDDAILLCSDGLSNQMADQEILFEVAHGASRSDCCQRLLDIALGRGAPDNVTVVLMCV